MRKSLALGLATVSLTGVGALVPAAANAGVCGTNTGDVCTATTNVTFTVSGQGMSISIPTPSAQPITLTGGVLSLNGTPTVSAALDATKVTDLRGVPLATWSVTVAAVNDFKDSSGDTITQNNGSMYLNGVSSLASIATSLSTTQTITAAATQATPAVLGTTTALIAGQTLLNTGSATYTPGLQVTIPSNAVAGTYTGAVTQTLS